LASKTLIVAIAALQVNVIAQNLAPEIVQLTDYRISVSTEAQKLRIVGRNFDSETRARINGQIVATSVKSSVELEATLPASILDRPSRLHMSLYNLRSGLSSRTFALYVYFANSWTSIAYSNSRQELYASNASRELIVYDPVAAEIKRRIQLSIPLDTIAISDDGQFLYGVSSKSPQQPNSRLLRLRTADLAEDVSLDLGAAYARGLCPVPGNNRQAVVLLATVEGRTTVLLVEDGVRKSQQIGPDSGFETVISLSDRAEVWVGGVARTARLLISDSGLRLDEVSTFPMNGRGMIYGLDQLYGNGSILNLNTRIVRKAPQLDSFLRSLQRTPRGGEYSFMKNHLPPFRLSMPFYMPRTILICPISVRAYPASLIGTEC
jgi:hypothetical protein